MDRRFSAKVMQVPIVDVGITTERAESQNTDVTISDTEIKIGGAVIPCKSIVSAEIQSIGYWWYSGYIKADMPEVLEWLHLAWTRPDMNVVSRTPLNDTQTVPKELRDPDRIIATSVRAAVLQRDGYRCRYCGIPVVHADIRKLAHRLYPAAVPWEQFDPLKQHAGFACLWLQFDHVMPHSHGGRSSTDNVVISCALCNYGKDKYTLLQLDVADPRNTPPVSSIWDGLERFRTGAPLGSGA